MALTPAVSTAIEEIRQHVRDCPVVVREDGEGGAFVIVENLALGSPYKQESTWCGFHITFQYPYSDVYPHFIRGDLVRVDARPLGPALTQSSFERRSAIQISRRSNKLNPATDTALLKLLKVLEWLKSR
jgi:hypothetical protein